MKRSALSLFSVMLLLGPSTVFTQQPKVRTLTEQEVIDIIVGSSIQSTRNSNAEAGIKQAKTLQSRLKEGEPSTAYAKALREKVATLTANGRQLPPAVLTAIGGLRAPLAKVDQAFGVAPATTS